MLGNKQIMRNKIKLKVNKKKKLRCVQSNELFPGSTSGTKRGKTRFRAQKAGIHTYIYMYVYIILTASDELRRYQAGEIGFLAVPEDPELLGGGEGERRGCGRGRDAQVEDASPGRRSGGGGGSRAGSGRRGGHSSPHAQNVTS